MVKIESDNSKTEALISGEMTIFNALDIQRSLEPLLSAQNEVVLNLEGVEEMDCAGIQLLLLIKKECGAKGCNVRITDHSDASKNALNVLGISELFSDPVVLEREKEGADGI